MIRTINRKGIREKCKPLLAWSRENARWVRIFKRKINTLKNYANVIEINEHTSLNFTHLFNGSFSQYFLWQHLTQSRYQSSALQSVCYRYPVRKNQMGQLVLAQRSSWISLLSSFFPIEIRSQNYSKKEFFNKIGFKRKNESDDIKFTVT